MDKNKPKYKIPFHKASKIELSDNKCGNCGVKGDLATTCKYSIKECDDFTGKEITKNKTTKLCGRCG